MQGDYQGRAPDPSIWPQRTVNPQLGRNRDSERPVFAPPASAQDWNWIGGAEKSGEQKEKLEGAEDLETANLSSG